jgi:hypothetical protein
MKIIKKFLLFLLIGLVPFVIFLHPAVLSYGAEWILQSCVSNYLGETLCYQKAYLNGNQLVIQHPYFSQKDHFQAECITIQCHLNWRKRQIDLTLLIDKPSWKLDSTQIDWDHLKAFFNQKKVWVRINPKIKIQDGLMRWHLPNQAQCDFHFTLEGDRKKGGVLKAHFDESHARSNCFTLHVFRERRDLALKWDCQDLHCSSLVELATLLFPRLEPWMISSGTLNGQLMGKFPNSHQSYWQGEVLLSNLAFIQTNYPLKGFVQEAKLTLEKKLKLFPKDAEDFTTQGLLEITQSATLAYLENEEWGWKLDQIKGNIQSIENRIAAVNLETQGHHCQHHSLYYLQGHLNLDPDTISNFNMTLLCGKNQPEKGEIHLLVHQLDKPLKVAEVECQHLSYIDLSLLQTLCANYWPQLKKLEFQEGLIDGVFHAEVTKNGVENVNFQKVNVDGLKVKLLVWNTVLSFPKWLLANGMVNFASLDVWHTLQADLIVEGGQASFADLDLQEIPFTDIQSHLLIDKGVISHSLVKLKVMGLKGLLDIQWGGEKGLITLDLQGPIQNLTMDLLPERLHKGLKSHFEEDFLRISANLKYKFNEWEIDGVTSILNSQQPVLAHLIHFGCELQNGSESSLIPLGWFHAQQIPLEKFLSPFIFTNESFQLSGIGEFKGSFNRHHIHVNYDAKDLKIENKDLLIELKELTPSFPNQLIGVHEFNLMNYSQEGRLPIRQASYLEKHNGLFFTDIQAEVLFKEKAFQLNHLEAFCQGIYLAGTLEVDYSHPAPGAFHANCSFPLFHGKISHLQSILSNLNKGEVLKKIALEADMEARDKGITLGIDFVPNHYNLQIDIQGSITNGAMPIPGTQIAIQDLHTDFDYSHQNQRLDFSEIQGMLLVGKPQHLKEYSLTGPYIRIQDFNNAELHFDLVVNDPRHQLARLAGYTKQGDDTATTWVIDKGLSHFEQVHPQDFQLILRNGVEVQHFYLNSQFKLQSIWLGLKNLSQSGLIGVLQALQDRLDQVKEATGNCSLILSYEGESNLLQYEVAGKDLTFDTIHFENCFLKGQKEDNKWTIDHFELDKLSLYAEVQYRQHKWKLDFLGLNYGRSLLLGLEGEIELGLKQLNAKINLLQIDLAYLGEWESMYSIYTDYHPQGKIEGIGQLTLTLLPQAPWYRIESDLQLNASQLACRDCSIRISQPFHLHACSDQKLNLNQVQLVLEEGPHEQAYIFIPEFQYDLKQLHLNCPSLSITLPCLHLGELGNKLYRYFPEWMNKRLKETLVNLKSEGSVKATLAFSKQSDSYSFQLALEEGVYIFKKRKYHLKDFQLTIHPNQLVFSALSHEERCPFSLVGTANWPEISQGELILIDSFFNQPLSIHWKDNLDHGFTIQSVQGYFCGLNIHLHEAPSEWRAPPSWTSLEGEMEIDFNRLCPLLRERLAQKIPELELGPCYTAKGIWWINPDQGTTLLETAYFNGQLIGQEAVLKGYQVERMQADVSYVPQQLEVKSLVMEDKAGQVTCEQLMVVKKAEEDTWLMFIPLLTVKNLKPCLLREVGQPAPSRFKNLLVRRINLIGFYADLDDSSSWEATGHLYFLNPSRKQVSHPLLTIPAEVILRLGLNPEVLNPVTGTIYFNLQGDRFYLIKFKDVYSEGRGSKFYLAPAASLSWMDLKGNLSVQVKMKQYNLIFKIAELFTVSIQGNLKYPIYGLKKTK